MEDSVNLWKVINNTLLREGRKTRMTNAILVIVAHPDDESISMGGTIRRHIDHGDSVYVASMTDGVSARGTLNDNVKKHRKACAHLASQALGFKWVECYDFPDNALDSCPLIEVVRCIEKAKAKYQPNIVYTHSGADLNVDHRVIANAVLAAFRPQPDELCKEIRLFEVASATDYGYPSITGRFSPNLFISIGDKWEAKVEALKAYSSEMRDYPHIRSIEGIKNLAKLRGNQVGVELAEAFEVIRKIEL